MCLGTLGFERFGKRKMHLEVGLVVANFEKEDNEKKEKGERQYLVGYQIFTLTFRALGNILCQHPCQIVFLQ